MEDFEFLKTVQVSNNIAMVSNYSSHKLNIPYNGYFIVASNYTHLIEHIKIAAKKFNWNPEARFLIVVKLLQDFHLKHVFNTLLEKHVHNTVIIDGSSEGYLYSYNPFANYRCGKHYDEITSYGKCSESHTLNLYPYKYVTGLRNCTLNVFVPHWPPYTIVPDNRNKTWNALSYGIEIYFLHLIGKRLGFTLNITLAEDKYESFSTVSLDMEAVGHLKMLQDNQIDIALGGLVLVPSRAAAFKYVYDLLPYDDELKFVVKKAHLVSLTTNPAREPQILTETDILRHKLKPCFSEITRNYYQESSQLTDIDNGTIPECNTIPGSIQKTRDEHQELLTCITDILDQYFAENFELTVVNIHSHEDDLLKTIHSTTNFALITRIPTQRMLIPNIGYLISSEDVVDFLEHFHYLTQERTWNPHARFLIVIKLLEKLHLQLIFNELLIRRVHNVIIVNGTEHAHLYTYNPYENYACGFYYKGVTHYGQCSTTTDNLYPNKLATGLKNCNFRALLAHRPPNSIDPTKINYKKTLLGIEEYVITILSELEHFTVTFNYSFDGDSYSRVAPNMTAIGHMALLQNKEFDIAFGGLLISTSRADGFSYLHGHYDYANELLFVVKKASLVPTWKYIYLEFQPMVWVLLLIAMIIYSIILIILLDSKDKTKVVLRLLENLILHGRDLRSRLSVVSVKCILITWVMSTYLINTFYQSSLFSLTIYPSSEYQISNEGDLIKYDVQPCMAPIIRDYIVNEMDPNSKEVYSRVEGCQNSTESLRTILSSTENYYTFVARITYLFNKPDYMSTWGEPLIYRFQKPFIKYLYGYFFHKGFPITQSLQVNTLRLRENGLTDKISNEHYHQQRLKNKKRFTEKPPTANLVVPWGLLITGFIISTVVFVVELLIKHSKGVKRVILRFK
ncbi:unnamed protein product [Arctia plantaginis]|uniref:Ionotropic receptor n=1 Tax=Arctia plantaginis TaxID=874455 RepID=A0A8S1AQM1_ARCPL|nr:unnamed protein product [Arctia plantaginis]CAB3247431.1 unnamed protein product [Arctia plantaginis]